VSRTGSVERGVTFLLRRPVGVMRSLTRSNPALPVGTQHLLEDYGRDRGRGRGLMRAQLAESVPGRSEDEIEDAAQSACQLVLLREPKAQRGIVADPTSSVIETVKSDGPGQVGEPSDRRRGTEG
jgi:hypothetical protein